MKTDERLVLNLARSTATDWAQSLALKTVRRSELRLASCLVYCLVRR